MKPLHTLHEGPPSVEDANPHVVDRSIGQCLRQARKLDDEQIQQVLAYQHEHGLRFGAAAVALGLVTPDDVLGALSQQFHYPYTPQVVDDLDEELIAATDPFSDAAEVFREMRSQILMELPPRGAAARALVVMSPDSGDGKSYFAANIAIAFSQLGGNTLLIDADMRTPRLHQLFRLGDGPGLSSILIGRCESHVIQPVPQLPGLYLLPVGAVPPNPLELVQRPAFDLLMRELLSKFDHVVIDTPAASHGADARVIAAHCGAALVIGRRGRTRMRAMQSLLTSLQRSGTRMAGVLVNEH